MSEHELYSLISCFLEKPESLLADEVIRCIGDSNCNDEANESSEIRHSLRGQTGIAAEREFLNYHSRTSLPLPGDLQDCRYDQCGYDYQIEYKSELYFIEVKGMAGETGAITFTDKEWKVAQEMGDKYFLVIVRNIPESPRLSIIGNPTEKLHAKIRLFTTIQTSWTCRIN